MANDDVLRDRLSELAGPGTGLRVQRLTAAQAKSELALPVGRSSNPVYQFEVDSEDGNFDAVAFTSILNGRGRPATRAEALGQAIASNGKELFEHCPFFLVFDFADNRFMAVSAAKLFGAFAEEADRRDIPYSDSATFSLSPSFDRKTINMYATVGGDNIWWCGDISELTTDELRRGLGKMQQESQNADVDKLVRATAARIAAAPVAITTIPTTASAQPASLPFVPTGDDATIELDARVWRMIVTAIRSSPAVILVGPPGTGKTALLRQAIGYFAEQANTTGGRMNAPLWATPDESWTTRDLVGGDTIIEGEIAFRPGWVPRSLEEDRWLVLDEANRADMDRIFGGLLTWLSGREVAIGAENSGSGAREIRLGWKPGQSAKTDDGGDSILYAAGSSWRLLGTYNALDAQRVFRFGQALGRRFVRVPIPAATPAAFQRVLESRASLGPESRVRVEGLYAAHYANEATLLGPALFIAISAYLSAAAREPVPDVADDPHELLAEAYVVNVGTWLAQLETLDLDALQQRTIDNQSLRGEDWTWIRSMLVSLA